VFALKVLRELAEFAVPTARSLFHPIAQILANIRIRVNVHWITPAVSRNSCESNAI